MTDERPDASSQSTLARRLWWLILGRAAVVIILLLIGVAWKRMAPGTAFIKPGSSITPLVLAVIGLTVVYFSGASSTAILFRRLAGDLARLDYGQRCVALRRAVHRDHFGRLSVR